MNKTIWFDINNSPHVLILHPIIKEFSKRGYAIVITARDYSQTVPLMEKSGLDYTVIGKHGGKSKLGKILSSIFRILRLIAFIKSHKMISASFCHGSRELIIVSKLLNIPSTVMFDYEYTEHRIKNMFATTLLVPSVVPDNRLVSLGYNMNKVQKYPGLKENIYLTTRFLSTRLNHDENFKDYEKQVLVVLRPPSTESHYHNINSEQILDKLFVVLDKPGVKTIILPRYNSQIKLLHDLVESSHNGGDFMIPEQTLDGPNLVTNADLCISGGGTMIREAAVVGTPAYSFFTGKKGAVDEFLEKKGRMVFIKNTDELKKIDLCIKKKTSLLQSIDISCYIANLFDW
jgi:predicted glycosyltransferase